jgi:hypothetical protein
MSSNWQVTVNNISNNPTSSPYPCNVAQYDTVQFIAGTTGYPSTVYFADNTCFAGGYDGLSVPSTSPYPSVNPAAGTYPFYNEQQSKAGGVRTGVQIGSIKVG